MAEPRAGEAVADASLGLAAGRSEVDSAGRRPVILALDMVLAVMLLRVAITKSRRG